MDYDSTMLQVQRTAKFDAWLQSLKDRIAQKQIIARLVRLSNGLWGDHKAVGGEVVELRLDVGPGYRIYCWQEGKTVVVALGGGDKSTQTRDIVAAQTMVKQLKE